MIELRDQPDATNLLITPLHLGAGSRAWSVQGFAWEPTALASYAAMTATDGIDGRLVTVIDGEGLGDHWERHRGDEVIVCLRGRVSVHRSTDDGPASEEEIVLGEAEATVNPAGSWHAVDMHGPARILTITPGLGTEHRPRDQRFSSSLTRASPSRHTDGGWPVNARQSRTRWD
jgi:mannose-6-phosphate isomerase-like protein (cupin superfamily)